MAETKKLLFIVNPISGRALMRSALMDVLDIFIKNGYTVTTHITQSQGDATRAAQRAQGYDLVVCSGGDGTFNETVRGLMTLQDRPDMGYIPAGTGNVLAVNLGLPRSIPDAARAIMTGLPMGLDLGTFNGSYFSLVAGFGAFTELSYLTPQPMKNLMGALAYVLEGIASLPTLKAQPVRLECDGRIIEDNILTGLISNVTSVIGSMGVPRPKGEVATMDDGRFDVLLIRPPTTPLELQQCINDLLSEAKVSAHYYSLQAAHIRVLSDQPLSWTLDGEFGGRCTEAEIQNHHRALKLVR